MTRFQVRSRVVLGRVDYYVIDTTKPINLGSDIIYQPVHRVYFELKKEAQQKARILNNTH